MESGNRRLFVGGLTWRTTEDMLARFFAEVGDVTAVTVVMDRDTGRSKGFGFVEMSDVVQSQQAIRRLDGATLDGRTVRVTEAMPRRVPAGPGRPQPRPQA